MMASMGDGARWVVWAVPFAVMGQTVAVLGLLACAVLSRRRTLPRPLIPSLIALLAASALTLIGVFTSFGNETVR